VKKYSAPEEHVLDGLTAPLETSHILTIPKLGRIWNMSFSLMPSSAPRGKHVILGLFHRNKTCGAPVESSDAILELEFNGFNNGEGNAKNPTIKDGPAIGYSEGEIRFFTRRNGVPETYYLYTPAASVGEWTRIEIGHNLNEFYITSLNGTFSSRLLYTEDQICNIEVYAANTKLNKESPQPGRLKDLEVETTVDQHDFGQTFCSSCPEEG